MNPTAPARFPLAFLPTPLIETPRLSEALAGPRLLMKRDDQTGLALGGNKARKLELLVADARARGCDCLLTAGAAQSNHCRQTAAAAARAGMDCHLLLGGGEPELRDGNLLLDTLMGAVVHWGGDDRKGVGLPALAESLREEGRRPYLVPYGGSNELGAAGFARAAGELADQLAAKGERCDAVVFATSSGGTQAGLAVGAQVHGLGAELVGIRIDKEEEPGPPYEWLLAELATRTASRVGHTLGFTAADFRVEHGYMQAGYGVVTALEREAIDLVGRTEGILLDPVYTGRAMGGLIDLIRRGFFHRDQTVVFWHTGGAPALFSYASELDRNA